MFVETVFLLNIMVPKSGEGTVKAIEEFPLIYSTRTPPHITLSLSCHSIRYILYVLHVITISQRRNLVCSFATLKGAPAQTRETWTTAGGRAGACTRKFVTWSHAENYIPYITAMGVGAWVRVGVCEYTQQTLMDCVWVHSQRNGESAVRAYTTHITYAKWSEVYFLHQQIKHFVDVVIIVMCPAPAMGADRNARRALARSHARKLYGTQMGENCARVIVLGQSVCACCDIV